MAAETAERACLLLGCDQVMLVTSDDAWPGVTWQHGPNLEHILRIDSFTLMSEPVAVGAARLMEWVARVHLYESDRGAYLADANANPH